MDASSFQLLQKWSLGNDRAAQEIFDRYVDRLIALARSRMSSKLLRRLGPEDIVQSVYRSFFRLAAQNRYDCEQTGNLWRLLATITINKVRHQLKFHSAKKRSLRKEESTQHKDESSSSPGFDPPVPEPTPDEALGLIEELEFAMGQLEPLHRQVMELRLQGTDVETIAEKVNRTERTVRRVLSMVETQLQSRLAEAASREEDD